LTSAGFDDLQNFHEAEKCHERAVAQTFLERRLQLFGKKRIEYCNGQSISFGAESFAFQFAIQKYKDYNIQNYKFACSLVWV